MDNIDELNEALERANPLPFVPLYPHVRLVRERFDPFTYFNDSEFVQRYRLKKTSVQFVVDLLKDELTPQTNHPLNVSAATAVLVALRYYSKGNYQIENADLHGLSQPTVSRCISKVSIAIAEKSNQFISMPTDFGTLKEGFFQKANCPNIIGCVDCTHIKIKLPSSENAALWCNRKGWYSINVQAVCDSSCTIVDIVARWRGSTHDARIWDFCNLKESLSVGNLRGKGIIFGDSGYPCKTYLLTPLNNPSTLPERRYNRAHAQTRVCIENTFGQWKAMFRSLQTGLLVSLDTAKAAIVAMAVLYNIRKQKEGDDFDSFLQEIEEIQPDPEDELPQNVQAPVPTQDGFVYRKNYIRNFFS